MDIIARTITQSSRCTRAPIISLVRFQGCLLHSFLTINSLTTRLVYNPTNPYHQPRGFVVDWIVVDWLSPLSAAAWLLSQSTTAGCEPVANKPPCVVDWIISSRVRTPLHWRDPLTRRGCWRLAPVLATGVLSTGIDRFQLDAPKRESTHDTHDTHDTHPEFG